MQIIFCVFLPTPTSLHMLDIWAERVQPILGSCLHYVSVPEIKQCIWGWSPLRTRLYQMQFSLYIRAHVFDMLMKVESCSESWLLHLDVTSLNSGGKKSAYITSIFCRPAAIQYIQHSQCGSITTAQKKLGKKRRKSTGSWMWALQLPARREAKGNSSPIKKSRWPHWFTLTHPQKLMSSLQPFYKAKKKLNKKKPVVVIT